MKTSIVFAFFLPALFFAPGTLRSETLPVTEGLLVWWQANDLSGNLSSGAPVEYWPDHGHIGAPLYVDGNTPPTFRTKEDTGLGTASVHFDNLPDNAPPNFDPQIAQFLNIPKISAFDLPWHEITIILSGRGLYMHTFQIGPWQRLPTFRHIYRFIQMYDSHWGASIEMPIPKSEADMSVVFSVVVDQSEDRETTVVDSYVNGTKTGEALLQSKEEAPTEPFEGIVFEQTSVTPDGKIFPGSAIGIAGRPIQDAEFYDILIYNRPLSAEEVAEVSRFLAEKF